MRSVAAALALLAVLTYGNNDDRFNYGSTIDRDYGPEQWDQVTCDEPGTCLGWPDGYESRKGWNFHGNQCKWCPANDPAYSTAFECYQHQQSPINLKRSHGIPGDEIQRECLDWHSMRYSEGSCTWNDTIDNQDGSLLRNNFIIDRHALQIMQPVDSDGLLRCKDQKFPRIDFSYGFPNAWYMYQTEVKVPSEHTQEGKRYDAEVQLDHVYSIDLPRREIGKVALFLQGYEGEERWDFLDKLICQWREIEEETRSACCLPSVPAYEGCRNPTREACETTDATKSAEPVSFNCSAHPGVDYERMCRHGACCRSPRSASPFCLTIYDTFGDDMQAACRDCCTPAKEVGPPAPDHPVYPRIQCSTIDEKTALMCMPGGCCDAERSTSSYCQNVYARHPGLEIHSICWYCCSEPKEVGQQRSLRSGNASSTTGIRFGLPTEENVGIRGDSRGEGREQDSNFANNGDNDYQELMHEGNNDASMNQQRHLVNFEHVDYKAYEWMRKVETEYYYRYQGSQTVPPCFSQVHWRLMKDPIRVHPDQIRELQRLLAWRIAPLGSEFNACQNDTAGFPVPGSNGNIVNVNRPVQSTTPIMHRMVFCECIDWESEFLTDQEWCMKNVTERFDTHPYNFDTDGSY